MPDKKRYYINDTGTGNTLNLSHPRVIQMVTDSLRYWVEEMHVDGFRFDLGTILAREPGGFDTHNGFMKAVMQDPVLAKVKLIAEPWDCGPGGYQVGGFPPGWAEWNDKFRDTVRDYWRGEAAPAALAPRLCGSPDVFNAPRPPALGERQLHHRARRLHAERPRSATTTSTTRRTARSNRDGHSHNRSWNHGAEGPTEDAAIRGLRKRQMKNMLATLLLSQGTPMLLAGDEFGRTPAGQQQRLLPGQRDLLGRLEPRRRASERLIRFVRKLTGLRHKYPILRRKRFLTGVYNEELGVKDVTWINAAGDEMTRGQWERRATRAASACCSTAARSRPASASAARKRRCSSSSTAGRTW